MSGFFDLSEVVTTSTDYLCADCGLFRSCKSPKMKPTGKGALKTLIIAEASGKSEDERGKQLVGEVGQFLRKLLAERGFDLDRDFYKTNALGCRPPENRKPTPTEITCCHPNIENAIRTLKPKFIWLFGECAIESYFLKRYTDGTPAIWRGLCIPDFENNAWVLPMYHPSYALRNEKDPLIMSQFKRDLDFAIGCLKKEPLESFQVPDIDNILVMKDPEIIKENLQKLIDTPPEVLAFDYETTGLKPFRKGHKIVSVSYSFDSKKGYAFPLQHSRWKVSDIDRKEVISMWCEVLQNGSKKVAHNAKFEDVWTRAILKIDIRNWFWDTQTTAHILDNRANYIRLKFQSFIHWGVPDYSKEIQPFLESTDERGYNRVEQFDMDKLLVYGGRDSLLTDWLYHKQISEVDDHLCKGVDLFTEGVLTLADMQMTGIRADAEYYKNAHIELTKMIKDKEEALLKFDECIKFKEVRGYLPNLGSSTDLRDLFYGVMGLKPPKETSKGNASVDAETMAKLDTPLAKEITELGRIKKIDGTYLTQFMREIDDDGRIHAFFDIDHVKTYRGSSARPNLQNLPVRNEEAKMFARSGVKPTKGWCILDFDYGAQEVAMGGCYTKDPVLVAYIKDPKTDMHRDTASDIFLLKNAPASYWKEAKSGKKVRFYAKNGFVFPEWYGSYYKNCATNLWNSCSNLQTHNGITIKEHLRDKGVITSNKPLDDFVEHVKEVEKAYWRKFRVFKKWQEGMYQKYEKTGIVELLTGFRCTGYMGRNEIVNYSFQGTAFHCLLWSLNQINAELTERKMRSKIVAQIHDSGILDCPPEECEEVKNLCTEIATQRIKEQYPWLIVPLTVEWESTAVDSSWFSKTDMIDTLEEE